MIMLHGRCCPVRRVVTAVSALVLLAASAQSQTRDDAVRFSSQGIGVGARSLGIGNAYTGVANDYSALYWNPAGLAQLRMSEFTVGLSSVSYKNASTFFDAASEQKVTATNLNALGIVYAVPTERGSATIAFGYMRHSNFRTALSFDAFNPLSTIVQSWAPDGEPVPYDTSMAEYLGLAGVDQYGNFYSPINDSLQQTGDVNETGGVDYWSFGGAIDIAKNVSVGITLTYVSGTYQYDRSYRESDLRGLYRGRYPYDVREILSDEFVKSDLSGFTTKFGIMYRDPGLLRIAFAVQTPMWMTVTETFGNSAQSAFYTPDQNGQSRYGYDGESATEYDVHSPWIYSAGASVVLGPLLLAADAEMTDWTTTEFADAPQEVLDQNKLIRNDLRMALCYRGGAELDIRFIGIRLRGGFIYNESPYKADPPEYDQKYITAGIGIQLGEPAMLDVASARGMWTTSHINNDSLSPIYEDITTDNILLTLSVRF